MARKIVYRFTGEISIDDIFLIHLTLLEETGDTIERIPPILHEGAAEFTESIGTREMMMGRDILPRIVLERMIRAIQGFTNSLSKKSNPSEPTS